MAKEPRAAIESHLDACPACLELLAMVASASPTQLALQPTELDVTGTSPHHASLRATSSPIASARSAWSVKEEWASYGPLATSTRQARWPPSRS